jgi:spore coat protein U-like protein
MNGTSRMKLLSRFLPVFVALLVVAGGSTVFGQASTTTDATATVLPQLTIVQEQDLAFGNVLPGDSAEVDVTADDAAVGIVRISGQATENVTVAIMLPTHLDEDVGTDKLVVEFSATDGAWDDTGGPSVPTDLTHTVYDPNTVLDQPFGAAGDMDIFIGGKIRARNAQTAGAYTGTIMVIAWYAGS